MPWYTAPAPIDTGQVRQVKLEPTPWQHRFITSEATIVVAVAALGEGKTWSCIMGLFYHAKRYGVPLRAAIIRDSYEDLKRTVIPAFLDFLTVTETPHQWHNEYRRLTIATDPVIHAEFLGIDDLAGVARIQGGEWGLIWLEEPSPYTDIKSSSAGLSEDVYNAALVRCARQRGTKGRLQISSNHPDEDHWFYRRCLASPDGMVDPRTPLITKEVIEFPRGSNPHLKEESRQAAIAAYAHDPIGYARFVEGKAATRYPGKAVVGRIFNEAIHVAPMPLQPVESVPAWIGYDSWTNPAAVLGQQWPDGRIWVLDEINDAEDIRDLLLNYVNPLIQSPRWRDKAYAWRQIGDRTMRQCDQSSHTDSAADVVETHFDPGLMMNDTTVPLCEKSLHGGIPFEPGPQTWNHIRLGITHALQWMVRGQPAILIDPVRCKRLIAALRGRWHYATNKSGQITSTMPVKDDHSHVADAFANAVCILQPWTEVNQSRYQKRIGVMNRRRFRSIASSYNTSERAMGER
jgi:hypothetical protein